MKKAVKIRYYIESLSVYDFKQDEIIGALYDLLSSLDDETVLVKQSRFFKLLTNHKSFRHYVSKLILTDDNAFTKAAAARACRPFWLQITKFVSTVLLILRFR